MKYDIFISYRRDGGYETAKHLFDLLTRDGYSVSFDIDTLRNGDFDTTLLNRIDECTDFILVLDAHAFDRTLDPSFPMGKDWLYQELSYAMKQNKNIIPVLLSGFMFPDDLPEDIIKVQKKNGPKYDKYYFDEFYKRLKTVFFETPVPKLPTAISNISSSPITFVLKITVDETSMLYIDDKKIRKIRQGTTANINTLKYGYKYKISLKNLATKDEEYTIEYEVPDKREGDEINVEFKAMRDERKKQELEKRIEKKQNKERHWEVVSDLSHKLILLCEENYDWFDIIVFNTVRVMRCGKYGFLNLKGFEIIPCVLADARNFEGEFAYIKKSEKWGIINQSGELVIDFICEEPSWITNDFTVLIQNGRQTLVNLLFPENRLGTFDSVIQTEFQNRFLVKDRDAYFLIDENGVFIGNNRFNKYYNDTLEENYVGHIHFPLIISQNSFHQPWLEELKIHNDKEGSMGLLDQNGDFLIPCTMKSVVPIVSEWKPNQYYKIQFGTKFGIYDVKSRSYSIPPVYDTLIRVFNVSQYVDIELWCVCNVNGQWGCINYDNYELKPIKYDFCCIKSSIDGDIWIPLSKDSEEQFLSGKDIGFIKLLSNEKEHSVRKGDNDRILELNNNYFHYIIDIGLINQYGDSNVHSLINFPFLYKQFYSSSEFIVTLMKQDELITLNLLQYINPNTNMPELIDHFDESLSDNKNNVKDVYYETCYQLYGETKAYDCVARLMRYGKFEYEFSSDYSQLYYDDNDHLFLGLKNRLSFSFEQIEEKSKKRQREILCPEIVIIGTESSHHIYGEWTSLISTFRDFFTEIGFRCISKETIIVLLTDNVYSNEVAINDINSACNKFNQIFFIGSFPLNENDPNLLKRWIKGHSFFETMDVISDKEILVLKLFAQLNEWDSQWSQ